MELTSITKTIENWNIMFPFDYIWRKKYNVPFNSEVHRNMDFFDIKFDVIEERMFQALLKELKKKPSNNNQLLKVRKPPKVSKDQLDQEFEDLDISQFNKVKV